MIGEGGRRETSRGFVQMTAFQPTIPILTTAIKNRFGAHSDARAMPRDRWGKIA